MILHSWWICVACAVARLSHSLVRSDTADIPSTTPQNQIQSPISDSDRLSKLLERVDPRIRPINKDGSAVNVYCGFHIMSFSSISEVHMDYKMSILFREIWMDQRLQYDSSRGIDVLSLSSHAMADMWIPDVFFPNEKDAKRHTITVPNMMIKIYPNGTVVHSVRLTLQLSCPMNLAAFPMDKQTCSIKIESFAYEKHQINLIWMDNPVERDEELRLPQFDFGDINLTICEKNYKLTGTFSCLRVDFTLYRQFGFFLLQTYVPTILIVVLSWVSFWINMDAVPARISLGVTTVLTMTTQLSGSTSSIPKVSYPKAIDVWLSVCMMFVFASLIEYAFVNALSRQNTKKKPNKTSQQEDHLSLQPDVKITEDDSVCCCLKTNNKDKAKRDRDRARTVDKLSRVLFPLAFLIFNFIYWPILVGKDLGEYF